MGTISADFEDETVVITGGSSGIGRAVALAFGDAGATVLNADIRPDPADLHTDQPVHEEIRERGGAAEYVETDISEIEDLDTVIEAAREYGGVDVMINNAAISRNKPFREITPEDLDQILNINTHGLFFGTQLAAEDMIDRGEPGVILNTTSLTYRFAFPYHSHYAATKGANRIITANAALELAQHDIRVNSVVPGPIATEILEGWSERAESTIASSGIEASSDEIVTPPHRAGQPEDLPGAYLYLASEQADYVVGEEIWVDGGSHLSVRDHNS